MMESLDAGEREAARGLPHGVEPQEQKPTC